MNAILNISALIIPLITFPYVARVLMPDGTGRVSFATSVVSYVIMISQLGIPTYGVRACAKVRDDKDRLSKVVSELFLISVLMTGVAYFVVLLGVLCVPRFTAERELIAVLSISVVLSTIGMEWLFRALEQYTYITVVSLLFKLVGVITLFFIVKSPDDCISYVVVILVSGYGSMVVNLMYSRRFVKLRFGRNLELKKHMPPILSFFAITCVTTVYTNLDTLMLGFMKDDAQVGYYHAAVRVKALLVATITSVGTVLLPRVSYYIEQGLMDEFNRLGRKAINCMAVISLPIAVYFIFFARECVYFLAGEAYEGAVSPMIIILPTLFLIGMTNIIGIQMLIPLDREMVTLASVVVGAVTDFCLNLIFIPKWGASGAAFGTLIAELVVFIFQIYALRGIVIPAILSVEWWKIICSVILSCCAAFLIKIHNFSDFVCLLLSAIVFFSIYFVALFFLRERFSCEILKEIRGKLKNDSHVG